MMATFYDFDISTACPSGLDPLDRAGQIQSTLGIWVRISGSGTPAFSTYGFISGSGRVESLDGTDLAPHIAGIDAILASGVAPTSDPFATGFTLLQLTGLQLVPFGTTVYYSTLNRNVIYVDGPLRWRESDMGTVYVTGPT